MTLLTVDLRTEAAAEAARLTDARALIREDDERARAQCETEGPWVAVARGSDLRRRLGGRALLLWRLSFDDGSGRRVESRLVGISIPASMMPSTLKGRAAVDAFLRSLDADIRERLATNSRQWCEDTQDAARAFVQARASRERAIAACRPAAPNPFQPGLFDARAQRGHALQMAAADLTERRAADRVSAAERAAALVPRPAELLLVLLP